MKKYFSIALTILAVFSKNVLADDGCRNPKTAYDDTYCTAKLFLESDKELNQTYSELRNIISVDAKKILLIAQRQWIQYRDNSCSLNGTINVDCNLKVNKQRQIYLNDRLRECKVGHCQNDLIASTNFNDHV